MSWEISKSPCAFTTSKLARTQNELPLCPSVALYDIFGIDYYVFIKSKKVRELSKYPVWGIGVCIHNVKGWSITYTNRTAPSVYCDMRVAWRACQRWQVLQNPTSKTQSLNHSLGRPWVQWFRICKEGISPRSVLRLLALLTLTFS